MKTQEIHPLLEVLNHRLKQGDGLAFLCCEIITTLKLPANQNHKLSENPGIILSWERQYNELMREVP